ncbi:Gfo/Idh/MocA family oxidoreductase [Pedobacter sp.]|uniref:Gfo/Idh/MocA family oxidoreductase n=1 Tax=Pedobacter sp. TaxID=1411316 RepID=UPI003D7F5600
MEKVIKTGILAYGMSGKVFHAPFLEAHPGFELAAVTERHHQNAALDYPQIKSYPSVEDLLNDESLALVVINTPNYTHFDYAKRALEKGKHIIVEKPFAATAAEAQILFNLAREKGKQVFVYQNRRWDSDFKSVRKILEQGVLGRLSEVHIRYDRYRPAISPKTFKEEPMAASGMQYDLGPHLLDQAISLFGQPLSHHKILSKVRKDTQVDDYFSIYLAYPNNVNVFVHSNILVADIQPAFVLHGEKGSFIKGRTDVQEAQLLKGMKALDPGYGLEEENSGGILTQVDEEGHKTRTIIPSEEGRYMDLFEAIYRSLVHGDAFPVKEEQVLWQLQILEADH